MLIACQREVPKSKTRTCLSFFMCFGHFFIFFKFMVRSTLLFLLLQKIWGTLKGVQGPPTFDMWCEALSSFFNSKILGVPKGCSRTSTTTKFFRFFIRLNVKIIFKFEYSRKLEQDRKFNHSILLLMAGVICGNLDRNSRNKDFEIWKIKCKNRNFSNSQNSDI